MATFRVLVPLDGSSLAEQVLPWVEHICLQAAEPGEPPRIDLLSVIPEAKPEEGKTARAHLEEVQRRLAGLGLEAAVHLRIGEPAQAILACARAEAPDLVAMCSHGRGGIARLVRGSVAEQVLRRCERPLLLVTPRTGEPAPVGKVLVPLDGSDRSAAVLPLVERVARAEKASVVLLRTIPDPVTRPVMAATFTPEWVQASLAPWKQRLEARGLAVEAHAGTGDPAREITREAERIGAGLIAMTTHGHEGFERLVEGSATEQVLRQARIPLLVVRAA